jgi:outer membrane lipoprotein-sorting protein
MFKKALALALPAVALLCICGQAQTLDDVLKKHLDARGGVDKIKAIKSVRASGKVIQGGMEIPISIVQKRPASFRVEVTFQGKSQIQAYDGQTGWKVDPFQGSSEPENMTADELKEAQEQADLDGSLVDYKTKGNTVELLGKEDVEGTPAYRLKVTLKSGDVRNIWLDAGNYLEIKISARIKTPQGELEIDNYPSNYKPVAGTVVAFAMERKMRGQTLNSLVLDKIETDVTLDDSLFKMPSKTDKPKSE